ncbi:hypothetical protein ABBQ32_001494 [Trebouxia sp. C0010 RCD-2024]
MLQLKQELRAALIAIRCFNVETGLIGENTKETGLLPIRMQWWRDAVNSVFRDKPVKHPVIQALAQVQAVHPLTRYRLQRLISTREEDLIGMHKMGSIAALEKYAEGTSSQLLYLQAEATEINDTDLDHASSHLGKAIGITQLLRGTVYHAQRRRVYLPTDLMSREGVTHDQLTRGEPSAALNNVVYEVASTAKAHLDEARAMSAKVPKGAKPLMLPAVACGLYLDALQNNAFDVFSQQMLKGAVSPFWHQLQVKRHYLLGSY